MRWNLWVFDGLWVSKKKIRKQKGAAAPVDQLSTFTTAPPNIF